MSSVQMRKGLRRDVLVLVTSRLLEAEAWFPVDIGGKPSSCVEFMGQRMPGGWVKERLLSLREFVAR
ncbi:hypothetical protein Mapa_010311 [Marchantia paleacea]|nr:hypothetical protein Mapa_010311 [Marchantia paleacea]